MTCRYAIRSVADSAPRMFHNLLHNFFIANGFTVNAHEPCLYHKWVDGHPILCLVHVDDGILVGTRLLVDQLKADVRKHFNTKELGALGLDPEGKPSLLLGMEIIRTESEFQIRQTGLIDILVKKCGNELNSIPHEKVPMRDIRLDSSSCPTTPAEKAKMKLKPFRSHLGVVGYLMLASRNECPFAYKCLSRFNDTYGEDHWQALLRLIAYLKKTRDTHYLCISKYGGFALVAYCDSDFNGCMDTHTSTTGWIVFLGGCPISWASRLQRAVARSTAESEFLAMSSCAHEVVYLKMLVASLRIPESIAEVYCNDKSRYENPADPRTDFTTAVKIFSDSTAAVAQAKKPEHWILDKMRHVRTAFFWFKQYVRDAVLRLMPVSGHDNPSDLYTKGFGAPGSTAANQRAEVFQRHADFCAGRRHH